MGNGSHHDDKKLKEKVAGTSYLSENETDDSETTADEISEASDTDQ